MSTFDGDSMISLADFIRDGCSARPEDKHSALVQLAALEKVATIARRQLHKLRAENDPDALELTNALADLPPKEKPPLYGGSPSLRDWADMHGELHEEKPDETLSAPG